MDSVIILLMSTPGKMLRVVVGLVVIGVGILIIQGTAGFVVAVIGLIPIFAAFGGMPHCSPLWVYSRGTEARVKRRTHLARDSVEVIYVFPIALEDGDVARTRTTGVILAPSKRFSSWKMMLHRRVP